MSSEVNVNLIVLPIYLTLWGFSMVIGMNDGRPLITFSQRPSAQNWLVDPQSTNSPVVTNCPVPQQWNSFKSWKIPLGDSPENGSFQAKQYDQNRLGHRPNYHAYYKEQEDFDYRVIYKPHPNIPAENGPSVEWYRTVQNRVKVYFIKARGHQVDFEFSLNPTLSDIKETISISPDDNLCYYDWTSYYAKYGEPQTVTWSLINRDFKIPNGIHRTTKAQNGILTTKVTNFDLIAKAKKDLTRLPKDPFYSVWQGPPSTVFKPRPMIYNFIKEGETLHTFIKDAEGYEIRFSYIELDAQAVNERKITPGAPIVKLSTSVSNLIGEHWSWTKLKE